jgi:hypothetical protein
MKKLLIIMTVFFFVFAGCGTDGKDGTDGTDGADGKDGIDGTNGVDGEDGKDGVNGTDGKDGADGEDGTNGTDGKDGTDGEDGTNGTDGEDGADGEDGKIPFGFDLIKPENNRTFATTSYATYTLAADVQEVRFIRTRISGTGPETDTVVLTGDDALAGYHESVEIKGAELTENDIYNLQVVALDMGGDIVELTPVFNLTVDNTGPELLKAEAFQGVFGVWNEGDRLIFHFNESMDTSNLSTINDVLANIPDVAASGDDFSGDLLVWSTDLKTLSITFSGSVGGTPFTAGADDSFSCSEFIPSSDVRDYAGNSNETAAGIKLISKGDVSTPRIAITSPADGSPVPVDPVVTYELSEDLVEAKLTITYLEKGSPEEIVEREWYLDPARLAKGTRTISFLSDGISELVDGAYYSIEIEGKDGAGNKTSDKISSLLADDTAPAPPEAFNIFVRNYSGEVVVEASETIGQAGDYLRLYVDGVLKETAKFPGPYGKTEDHVVISGLSQIDASAAIQYSLIDKAGNESELVSDGSMLPAPTSGDIANLGLRAGTTDYQLAASGTLSPSMSLFTILNLDTDKVFNTGWTDGGGAFSASQNSIPASEISSGTEIHYIYHDSATGHYSYNSVKDGEVVSVTSMIVIDNDIDNNISPNDQIEVTTTGAVYIPAGFSQTSYGSALDTAGGYKWSAALRDFNVAPVSAGYLNSFSAPGFWTLESGGSALPPELYDQTDAGEKFFYINMNFASGTGGPIDQIMFEVKPNGTNYVLSSDGDHCVLPATQIEADGTTGGLISSDF